MPGLSGTGISELTVLYKHFGLYRFRNMSVLKRDQLDCYYGLLVENVVAAYRYNLEDVFV